MAPIFCIVLISISLIYILIFCFPLCLDLPRGRFLYLLIFERALLSCFILATCPGHLNVLLLIILTILVEPSPLPFIIALGPKYSPQDPVFKYP